MRSYFVYNKSLLRSIFVGIREASRGSVGGIQLSYSVCKIANSDSVADSRDASPSSTSSSV